MRRPIVAHLASKTVHAAASVRNTSAPPAGSACRRREYRALCDRMALLRRTRSRDPRRHTRAAGDLHSRAVAIAREIGMDGLLRELESPDRAARPIRS